MEFECTMKLIILLLSLNIAYAVRYKDLLQIKGRGYYNSTLMTGLNQPFSLDSDQINNDLYLGYTLSNNSAAYEKLDMRTNRRSRILTVNESFASAINFGDNELYLGSLDGIYKYNLAMNTFSFYGAAGKAIWKMYYNEALYFTTQPDGKLYVFNKDGNYSLFEDLKGTKVLNFVIDDDDMMYFNNDTGLYKQLKGTKDAVLIKAGITIRNLVIGDQNRLHVCQNDGVYRLDGGTLVLEKLFSVDEPSGLAFDKDLNYVYSAKDSVRVLEVAHPAVACFKT